MGTQERRQRHRNHQRHPQDNAPPAWGGQGMVGESEDAQQGDDPLSKSKARKEQRKQSRQDAKQRRIQTNEQAHQRKMQRQHEKEEEARLSFGRRGGSGKRGRNRDNTNASEFTHQRSPRTTNNDNKSTSNKKKRKTESAKEQKKQQHESEGEMEPSGESGGGDEKYIPAPIRRRMMLEQQKQQARDERQGKGGREKGKVAPISKKSDVGKSPQQPKTKKATSASSDIPRRTVTAVTSLCNKLTLQSFSSVATQLVDLYLGEGHARYDVVAALCRNVLVDACITSADLTTAAALAHVGVVRQLQLFSGNDVAANVVEFLVNRLFREYLPQCRLSEVTDEKTADRARHCAMLLGLLYDAHVADNQLPLSVVRRLLEDRSELGIEAVQRMLQTMTPRLRRECPMQLQSIVAKFMRGSGSSGGVPQSKRYLMMLDTVGALIRSTKVAAAHQPGANDGAGGGGVVAEVKALLEALCEAVTPLAQKGTTKRTRMRLVESQNVLEVTASQCLAEGKEGKWWIAIRGKENTFGGGDDEAEDEQEESEYEDSEDERVNDGRSTAATTKKQMIALKRSEEKALAGQRLNTDTRRDIFRCIADATDDLDCFHKLAQRDPGTVALSDVANVLVQCCVQEDTYNAFYAKVAHRFVSAHGKKFKSALQFALWDRFKFIRISVPDVAGYLNLSCLIAYLFRHELYGLALLRGLDIHNFTKNIGLLVRILLLRIIIDVPERAMTSLFFGGDIMQSAIHDINVHTGGVRDALHAVVKKYLCDKAERAKWMPKLLPVVSSGVAPELTEASRLDRVIRVIEKALVQGV